MTNQCQLNLITNCLTVQLYFLQFLARVEGFFYYYYFLILDRFVTSGTFDSGYFRINLDCNCSSGKSCQV